MKISTPPRAKSVDPPLRIPTAMSLKEEEEESLFEAKADSDTVSKEEPSIPTDLQRSEILLSCRVTCCTRHECAIFSVYPISRDHATPWAKTSCMNEDGTAISDVHGTKHSESASKGYHSATGPPIWQRLADGTEVVAEALPAGQPVRRFVASLMGGGLDSSDTCSVQRDLERVRPMPTEKNEFVHMASRGYQTGSFRRKWSMLELCRKMYQYVGSSEEATVGLIRRKRGWSPGKCGHASVAGYAPFEILDFRSTTEWKDTAELPGWTWVLKHTNDRFPSYTLTCYAQRYGPALFRFSFPPSSEEIHGRFNCITEDEKAFARFELYEEYHRAEMSCYGYRWPLLEKAMHHGIMLVEKIRSRKGLNMDVGAKT